MSEKKSAEVLRVSAMVRAQRAFALFVGVLQEIFDESAYRRFLVRAGRKSSREAYADFLREGQAVRERKPRCC